jgi:FtsP/CotA-like multicopper oxidase with cupredoxin domain
VANYYFRIGTGGGRCDGPNAQAASNNTMGAIVQYQGAGDVPPSSIPLQLPSGCTEEQITPFVTTQIPPPKGMPTVLAITLDTSVGVFWKVNGQAMDVDWKTPTLQYVINGTYQLPANDNGIIINEEGWAYYVLTNDTPLPHPIHLHGHDFWVIGEGKGKFDFTSGPKFNLKNPPRRDTHQVTGNNGTPGAGGYVVIAFKADNPGTWLMHCHIPFHISGGLGLQFVERPTEIIGTLGDLSIFTDGCSAWNTFEAGPNSIGQPDSGLKRRARMVRRS